MATMLDLKPIRDAAMDVPGVGVCVVFIDHSCDAIVIKNYFGVYVLLDHEVYFYAKYSSLAVRDLVQREVRRSLEAR